MDTNTATALLKEELRKFRGVWKQISYERDGIKEPLDEQGWCPTTTFTDTEFTVTLADGSVPLKGSYTINPSRYPKTVNWTDTIGEDAGKTLLAIYFFEEDRLCFCAAYPGLKRPTAFRTRPGQVMRTFRRERSDE